MGVFRYIPADHRDQIGPAQRTGVPHQHQRAVAPLQHVAGPAGGVLAGRGDHRGDIGGQQGAADRGVVLVASALVSAESAWRTASFVLGEGCRDMRWRSAIAASQRRRVVTA